MNLVLQNHIDKGRYIHVGSTQAFVIDKGEGEPIICIHGVPASSFLYRKVIDQLVANGTRGISFDLLGMGISAKPETADYSWTGLGEWSMDLIEAMNIDKFHLLIHDIGGPIGCEIIAKVPERILSVSILNAPIANLSIFKKPFPMFFFEMNTVGEIFLATTTPLLFQKLMHLRGIQQNNLYGKNDAKAYVTLLKEKDNGKAFLKIMRSFEASLEKEKFYLETLKNLNAPKQIIWGINDPGLTLEKYGLPLQEALGLDEIIKTPGSHFLQEDYSEMIVENTLKLLKQ